MADDKSDIIKGEDMGLRYGGRVIKFEIIVNTDAEHHKIAKALYNRARGPRRDAAAIAIAVYEGKEGEELWAAIQDLARDGTAIPGFPDEEKPQPP